MSDAGDEFVMQIRKAFNEACPTIPIARSRFADLLGDTSLCASELTAGQICELAHDLGLEIVFALKAKP